MIRLFFYFDDDYAYLGSNNLTDNKFPILRRALLLRSLCENKLAIDKNPDAISTDIIRAMLNVSYYKHGARSMEAILDMSRVENGRLEPASLPAKSQLSLHVDAHEFIKLVVNDHN